MPYVVFLVLDGQTTQHRSKTPPGKGLAQDVNEKLQELLGALNLEERRRLLSQAGCEHCSPVSRR